MFSKKPQVIKLDQRFCEGDVNDNDVLFIRIRDEITDKNARIEVPFTHNAIIIKGGGDARYYPSGNYDVFDSRAEVKSWKSGLSVEVVYIAKDTAVPIKWGTPNRITLRDAATGRAITVGARGEFEVTVSNPELFFRKIVGVKQEFNRNEFSRRFSETVATEFAEVFTHAVADLQLTYDKFVENKKMISSRMGEILSPKFENQYGLKVVEFKIADFDLHDEDKRAMEQVLDTTIAAKAAREEAERLDDKNWERQKYLREMELREKTAYYDAMKTNGTAFKPRCPHCGGEHDPMAVFCPACGKRVSRAPITCTSCGKVNDASATFCSGCGKKL
ncbi:MAG: SPFH domain-containing protein [Clostridiales bacterium]|nr:SPFH domain-containing protein [Clostridiales bacterium]